MDNRSQRLIPVQHSCDSSVQRYLSLGVMVKAVVAIDDDVNFLDKLRLILDDLGLLGDFEFCPILARGQTPSDVSAQCITEITDIVRRRLTIAIVLVDIVNIERGEPPSDRSGLEVAKEVNSYLPSVPIVGITRYIKSDRILSEVSLDPYLEGIL